MPDLLSAEQQTALEQKYAQAQNAMAGKAPLPLEDAGVEGFVVIGDTPYYISGSAAYCEGGWLTKSWWYELTLLSLKDGSTWYLEWEREKKDSLSVYRFAVPLTLKDVGLSVERLETLDDEDAAGVRFQGILFEYEDDGEAHYFAGAGPQSVLSERQGETFYYWDLFAHYKGKLMGVERWGQNYEVWLGDAVDPVTIKVLPRCDA